MRNFECKDCGKSFSSEEKGQVKCPHCGSDNVDYSSLHIPYKYISVVVCVCLVIFLLFKIDYQSLFSSFSPTQENDSEMIDSISDSEITENTTQEELIQEIQDLGIVIPPTIKGIDKMELDDSGNYNVEIKIDHAPEKGYWVVITDVKTNKTIAKSSNGTFKGVPCSNNEGKYYAQIINASTNEALSEWTEITGFKKIEQISKKLSKSELQDLINKQDPSLRGHDNEFLSPVYKLKYENLPKDYEAPDNLSDVIEMLNMEAWTSVEVTSLEYDDTKHISSITLKVKMPSRPEFAD